MPIDLIKQGEVMGRAIDMEKDIDVLKTRVSKLEEILNEISKGIDDEEKETNNERSRKRDKQTHSSKPSHTKSNRKSRDSS